MNMPMPVLMGMVVLMLLGVFVLVGMFVVVLVFVGHGLHPSGFFENSLLLRGPFCNPGGGMLIPAAARSPTHRRPR